MNTILITGAAGFIGSALVKKLLTKGCLVIGVDNLNNYYDPQLKYDRLQHFGDHKSFIFYNGDITDNKFINDVFNKHSFDTVVNLAAQAGVRYSIENPYAYVNTNVVGFLNILESSRNHKVKHLVYASSSSVYGLNENMPFSEHESVDHPISMYAATKKSNEMMAHSFSHLFGLPTTGLRFFTVYGPWGRPDMALFLFTKSILNGDPIKVFNHGNMKRDFTYIDDITEGVCRVINNPPIHQTSWDAINPDPATSSAPFRILNIGNNSPISLMEYIQAIEEHTGHKARIEMLPLQDGDVPETFADTSELFKLTQFKPSTSVFDGVGQFVRWYREYYDL